MREFRKTINFPCLHGGVVDDHLLELDGRVELGDLLARPQEEAVAQLHDVRLVHRGHLLAAVPENETIISFPVWQKKL